jgi:hypothetical protein
MSTFVIDDDPAAPESSHDASRGLGRRDGLDVTPVDKPDAGSSATGQAPTTGLSRPGKLCQ